MARLATLPASCSGPNRIISARRAAPAERAVYDSGGSSMAKAVARRLMSDAEPVRVLGRGVHARRGVRLTLRVLREAAGKTQADLATLTQIDQADVSRLERRQEFDDCLVATLRRVVEALGGQLELVAAFGNKRIVVTGVEDAAAAHQSVAAIEARRRPRSRAPRGVSRAGRATSSGVGLRR